MRDLIETCLKRGLDMDGPDHLWYHGSSSPKIIRKRPKREYIPAEIEYAIALLSMYKHRTVARWLHRDDCALRKAVHRHQSKLTLVK